MKRILVISLAILCVLSHLSLVESFTVSQITLNENANGQFLDYIDERNYASISVNPYFITNLRGGSFIEYTETSSTSPNTIIDKKFQFNFKIIRGNDESVSVFLSETNPPSVEVAQNFDLGNYIEIKFTKEHVYINVFYDGPDLDTADDNTTDSVVFTNVHQDKEMWVQVRFREGVLEVITHAYDPQKTRQLVHNMRTGEGTKFTFGSLVFRFFSAGINFSQGNIYNQRSYIKLGIITEFTFNSNDCNYPLLMVPNYYNNGYICRHKDYFSLSNTSNDFYVNPKFGSCSNGSCSCGNSLTYFEQSNTCECNSYNQKYNPSAVLGSRCETCPLGLFKNRADTTKCSLGIYPQSPMKVYPKTCGSFSIHPQMQFGRGWACLDGQLMRRTSSGSIELWSLDGNPRVPATSFGNCQDERNRNISKVVPYVCQPSDFNTYNSLCYTGKEVLDDLFGWKCPFESGIGYMAVRRNYDNGISCLSYNGIDCEMHHNYTDQKCKEEIKNITRPIVPLVCGNMLKQVWGTDGINTPGHWCQIAYRNIYDGLCFF